MNVIFRLVGGKLEGKWHALRGTYSYFSAYTTEGPIWLVDTGDVEWAHNNCARVFVPEHKLEYYKAEFQGME